MEALVSIHPLDIKKVFVTGADRLQECKNTKFVWELREVGPCEGGLAVCLRELVFGFHCNTL